MTIIYKDFFIYKLVKDLEVWYNENYYPHGYRGVKPELEHHIRVLESLYESDTALPANEWREFIFNKAQDEIHKIFLLQSGV